jgi:hypothetical protein
VRQVRGCVPLTLFDSLVKLRRLRCRLDAQFLSQEAAAGLVVRQRRATPPTQRQQAHHLLVGCLLPRLQFQLPPGIFTGLLVLATLFVVAGQTVKGRQGLALQPLSDQQGPIIKGRAAL